MLQAFCLGLAGGEVLQLLLQLPLCLLLFLNDFPAGLLPPLKFRDLGSLLLNRGFRLGNGGTQPRKFGHSGLKCPHGVHGYGSVAQMPGKYLLQDLGA